MGIVEGVVIYLLVWWVTLFAVLPWGVVTQADIGDVEEGTDPAAPTKPNLRRKLLLTSAIAFGLWLVAVVVIQMGWIYLKDPA